MIKINKKYYFSILLTFLGLIHVSFGQTISEIARKGISSTVSIVSLDRNMQPLGHGSGFIINNQTIVTNVHVVEGASKVYILKNNSETKYNVNGFSAIDRTNDLVVLNVNNLYGTSIPLADEKIPEIGQRVYAIGNPKGLKGTFSEGIVSGIRDFQNRQVIQITAPISPGSSGGPIIDSSGKVIGVAFGGYNEGQNLNFAIPVKYIKSLIKKQSTVQAITLIKKQSKAKTSTNSSVKEGIQVRNIIPVFEYGDYYKFTFSIKNNLPYSISDISILFLVYDRSGTIVDYFEGIFFRKVEDFTGIRPYLARSYKGTGGIVKDKYSKILDYYEHLYLNSQEPRDLGVYQGYKIRARVLDFKINE